MLRRANGSGADNLRGGTNSAHLNALAFLSERSAANSSREADEDEEGTGLAPPRGSSRRNRAEDLEQMMIMEAIRLSLVSEEERSKKEEKEAKKKAKKDGKDAKKADKARRKSGMYPYTNSSTPSAASLNTVSGGGSGQAESSALLVPELRSPSQGKGKSIERSGFQQPVCSNMDEETLLPGLTDVANHLSEQSPPISIVSPSEPLRKSHLRQMSNASSPASSENSRRGSLQQGNDDSSSSIEASHQAGAQEGNMSSTPAVSEPMFNFRSLAEMIGEEEKSERSAHVENADEGESKGKQPAVTTQENHDTLSGDS